MKTKFWNARTRLGLTQGTVAIRCGVSLYTYQLWERGITHPKPENEVKLYKVLDIKE